MKAYVFPGQGAQFVGMGQDLYNSSNEAKNYFDKANDILGFGITDIMFAGSDEPQTDQSNTARSVFALGYFGFGDGHRLPSRYGCRSLVGRIFGIGGIRCTVVRRRLASRIGSCFCYAESLRNKPLYNGSSTRTRR